MQHPTPGGEDFCFHLLFLSAQGPGLNPGIASDKMNNAIAQELGLLE
jgi:hypothetical protein